MKRGGRINRESAKRAAQNRKYAKQRVAFLERWPRCQSPVECLSPATEVHHMKGRVGPLLLDESFWMALCSPCHRFATVNPAAALELGLSLSRLAVEA